MSRRLSQSRREELMASHRIEAGQAPKAISIDLHEAYISRFVSLFRKIEREAGDTVPATVGLFEATAIVLAEYCRAYPEQLPETVADQILTHAKMYLATARFRTSS
jgi:hypothetical protein